MSRGHAVLLLLAAAILGAFLPGRAGRALRRAAAAHGPAVVAPAGGEAPLPGKVKLGGGVGPDGKTQVVCDLPPDQRTRNVGGRDGAGLCVFTSIGHAARWQNERRLVDFQKEMRQEDGGGYPEKVDRMIARYGPGTPYVQYEGKDPSILKAALASGRMPSVTYDGRDGVHYAGRIAHMVNLVAYDEAADLACVLDNNFIGENELVWLSCREFLDRWGGDGGWAVILLAPPPPPPPHH